MDSSSQPLQTYRRLGEEYLLRVGCLSLGENDVHAPQCRL